MTTSQRTHRALLVLTTAPAADAHGSDPLPVFTTEGWTVDVTRVRGRSPEPQIPGTPLRTPRPEQLGFAGQPGLAGADHDSARCGSADFGSADYDIICFVDGHTTTWISPGSSGLSRIMGRISEYGEIIPAVRPAAFNRLEEFSLHNR